LQGNIGGGGGGSFSPKEAWETLKNSLDFWEWIIARLMGFPRPQTSTVTAVDQFLGGLPVQCWAEVMERAGLSHRTKEDVLASTEFQRIVETILCHRNAAFCHHRDKAKRHAGHENFLGISLSLISSTPTPFLMVTDLPADVTHAEMITAFRPDARVPDRVMFEDIDIPVRGGVLAGSKAKNVMPQTAAILSFQSEETARLMRDMWDGGVLRPQHPRRMAVRFSLGLNRSCIWIGAFSGKKLSAIELMDYATR
ncbi:unnamed protein product, partial [Ectocarpus sp. 12 AP-2014]